MRVSIEDGKYEYVAHEDGRSEVLRYGESWRDCVGDKFTYCMAAEIESLRQQLASIKRPDFREMREMLRAMQAGELTVSRGIEILEMWSAGNWNDDMLPPVRQDLIEEDSMPVEIIDRLRQQRAEKDAEIDRLRSSCKSVGEANERLGTRVIEAEKASAAGQAREQQLRGVLAHCSAPFVNSATVQIAKWRVQEALALPQDTAALEALIAKAGEVMRERCVKACNETEIQTFTCQMVLQDDGARTLEDSSSAIRALPGVTLEDLK